MYLEGGRSRVTFLTLIAMGVIFAIGILWGRQVARNSEGSKELLEDPGTDGP